MKKLLAFLLVIAMVFSFSLIGCTPSDNPDDDTSGGETASGPNVFNVAIPAEPRSMDHHIEYVQQSQDIMFSIWEPLVKFDNGTVVGSGAESWTVNDDKTVFTFKIREGMKWTDGEPLTAKHYYDAFERQFNPGTNTPYGNLSNTFLNGTAYNSGEITDFSQVGVKMPDDYTLELTTAEPCDYFLSFLCFSAFLPIRLDIVENQGESYGAEAAGLEFCGAYKMTKWEHESLITLEKNPDYWDADNVKIDTVNMHIVLDANTRANMFDNGELDFIELEAAQYKQYENSPYLDQFLSGTVRMLMFQCTDKYLSNPNLRAAMGWSLDRASIGKVLEGKGTGAQRFVPDVIAGADKPYAEMTPEVTSFAPEQDMEKAKEYLQKALDDFGMSDVSELPEFPLLAIDNENGRLISEMIQDNLDKNLGIKTKIDIKPMKQKFDEEVKGDFVLNYTGWGPDFNDPMGYLYAFDANGNYGYTNWDNSEVVEILKKSKATTDSTERMKYLGEAEQAILDGMPIIPFIFESKPYLLRDTVTGIQRNIGGMELDFIHADIKQ